MWWLWWANTRWVPFKSNTSKLGNFAHVVTVMYVSPGSQLQHSWYRQYTYLVELCRLVPRRVTALLGDVAKIGLSSHDLPTHARSSLAIITTIAPHVTFTAISF